jgi:intein/homing endonuclease
MFDTAPLALSKNCLSCSLYLSCKDKAKSVIFSCSRYKETPASKDAGFSRLFEGGIIPTLPSYTSNTPAIAESTDFDIYKLVESIIDSDALVSPDIKINDSDFRLSPNFYTFVTGEEGLKEKPFLEQALIGTRVFSEYCPRCSDMKWMNNHKVDDPLSKFEERVQLLNLGRCPRCKARKSELVANQEIDFYQEMAIAAGQRSGKSALLGMMSGYLTHWELMLQNTNELYGLMGSNILHGTFVALTFAQAKDTLWEPYYGYLLESPFFVNYHNMLRDAGNRYGEELLKLKDTFVHYRHRKLLVYPAGPDKRTLRGRTRFLACLTGDTLVSTNKGLIPIRENLTGLSTNSGNSNRNIINHWYTGKREVFKVQTDNGLYEKATANHEFRVLSKCKTKLEWKRVDQLTLDDYMVVSLGGEFPKSLALDYKYSYSRESFANHRALSYMLDNSCSFYLQDVADFSGKTYRGVTAMMTRLKRSALVSRKRVGRGTPFEYSISNTNKFKKLMALPLKGKINKQLVSLRFPDRLTKELAYILGYLVADGKYINCNDDNDYGAEVAFCSTSLDKIEHFKECFIKTFGITPRVSSWERKDKGIAYQVVFAHKEIKNFLRYVGLKPAWARVKEVPWSILQSPKACVAAFLSAAISCDGIIKDSANYSKVQSNSISYSSRSRKLIHHMQLLFIRLGYACNSTLHKGNRRIYALSLSTIDRDAFLKAHWSGLSKRENHLTNTLYSIKGTGIRYTIPGLKVSGANVHTKSSLNKQSKPSVKQYANLIDKGLAFTKVSSIKSLGVKKVYDLTVSEADHEFTANGLVASNSVDELGWFNNDANSSAVKMNATEVYIALERSLLTVRAAASKLLRKGIDKVPSGYFLNISSPSSVRDKIMELVKQSQRSRKIFGLIKPTWEMNPTITKDDLSEEFTKDPIAAMRDYGAQPPLSSSPYIANKSVIEQCFHKKANPCAITYTTKTSKRDDSKTRYAHFTKLKPSGKASVLALDAGFSNNSFACVMGHLLEERYPIIDLCVEIQPLPGIPLNFSKIYEHIITPLIQQRNAKYLVADRWNSLKMLSDAEEQLDIVTEQVSLSYSSMCLVRDYMKDQEMNIPKPELSIEDTLKYDASNYPAFFKNYPISHLILQLLTVQDTGSSVIKGEQLTDDIARAMMLCVAQLLDPNVQELINVEDEEVVQRYVDVKQMGVYRGGSGGSSGSGNSSSSSSSALGIRKSRG